LEQALDISKRYPDQLDYDQFVGLVARSAYEGSYDRARSLVIDRISPSEVDTLTDGIDQAKDHSSKQGWKGLLPIAAKREKEQKTFKFVLANFLQEIGYGTDLPKLYSIFTFKTSAELFDSIGLESFTRTSRFQEHYLRGQRGLKIEDFESARQDLEAAREYSLKEIDEYGEDKFTRLADSWFYLCRAKLNYYTQDGEIEEAIDYLNDAVAAVEAYDDFPDETEQTRCRTRIEALLCEANGDKHLRDQDYSEAESSYGKAIGKLSGIDRDLDNEIRYLKNRRLAIEASIMESDGEYDEAAKTYDKLEAEPDGGNPFVLFHETRSELCRVKAAIVESDFEVAERLLGDVGYTSNALEVEVNQIESLLELLRNYHRGGITEIDQAWDILEEAKESDRNHVDIDFGYGHDYRPAFVNIIGAQRLKNLIEDEEMIDPQVDIAIRDVLNSDVDQIISQEGFSYSSFDESWKNRIPDFITRQIQDIKQEAAKKRSSDNYVSPLESLTGLLEECLEVFVAYDARERYGMNWQSEVDQNGDVSMGNLSGYINKDIFESDEIAEKVRKLISQEKFGDIVLDDQDDDIVGVRNDLAHNNVSSITQDEFCRVRDHVYEVFTTVASEMPVLGKVGEGSQLHGYSVELLVLDHRDRIDIVSDTELQENDIYYFTGEVITSESIKKIDSDEIWSQEAADIFESIESHSDITIS
jgi:NTP pyrophosphatase (non-canonical NTP hydrolase)